jgi:hypothetical protein
MELRKMFSSILKIIPRLDASALRGMERTLNGRFMRIAKSFGRGIINIFKGGGWLGAAMLLINRILNPLKEVNDSIDRMLQASDQVVTNAKHFNTSSGKLLKLTSLAKSTGLTEDALFMAMNRYQTQISEAQEDPTRKTAVRQFVGIEDTADSFFEFIQALQKMSPTERQVVQAEVFGEKQILKMAEFLQQDFTKKYAELGLDKISTDSLTKDVEHLAGLEDFQAALAVQRDLGDMQNKARLLNRGVIKSQDDQEKRKLQMLDKNIANYQNLAKIAAINDKILEKMNDGMILVSRGITVLENLYDSLKKTKMWRFFGMGDKPKNGRTKELDWENPDPYSK